MERIYLRVVTAKGDEDEQYIRAYNKFSKAFRAMQSAIADEMDPELSWVGDEAFSSVDHDVNSDFELDTNVPAFDYMSDGELDAYAKALTTTNETIVKWTVTDRYASREVDIRVQVLEVL